METSGTTGSLCLHNCVNVLSVTVLDPVKWLKGCFLFRVFYRNIEA